MKKMGAKSASKIKYKGTAYKCDLCSRKFMSLEALKSHQRSKHHLQPGKPRLRQNAKQVTTAGVKEKPIKKAPAPDTVPTPNRPAKKKEAKVDLEVIKPDDKNEPENKNTVEFECPKCFRTFQTYFPALRHIQKFHPVDKKGTKVSPNSQSIIQPIRKELCVKCNRKVKSIPTHICGTPTKIVEDERSCYKCSGCNADFNCVRNFYTHVMVSHPEGVESLFFPTNTDFESWRETMETQTGIKYSQGDKYESKCYYHCENSLPVNNCEKPTIELCPSIIVIQEFLKGIQVHFYKNHYKHDVKEYKLINRFKKYSITAYLKCSDAYFDITDVKCDENDIYMQFKTLMESIVLDAAKLKVEALKILHGKALEMTSILTNYDDEGSDDSSRATRRTMTDTQISRALEECVSKRKNFEEVDSEPFNKRPRNHMDDIDTASPKILNSFSLADNSIKENLHITSNPIEVPSIKVRDISSLQNTVDMEPMALLKRIEEEDSKMEEIKDSKIESTVNVNSETHDDSKDIFENIKSDEPNENDSEKPDSNINEIKSSKQEIFNKASKSFKLDLTPSSFNESYAEFLEKNFQLQNSTPSIKNKAEKRNIVKTKIGQFKPSPPKRVKFDTPQGHQSKDKHTKLTKDTNAKALLKQLNASPVTKTNIKSAQKQSNFTPTIKTNSKSVQRQSDTTPTLKTNTKTLQKQLNTTAAMKTYAKGAQKQTNTTPVAKSNTKHAQKQSNNPTLKTYSKSAQKELNTTATIKANIKPILKQKNIKSKPLEKPKVDIKYEVKEREDDCNILILKI